PGGWLAVSLDLGTRAICARVFPDAVSLFSTAAAITAIDIPIGLPDKGARRCEAESRARLGARRSSVFPVPPRCALDADSYETASSVSFDVSGKRLSKQTWAIVPKIREVDASLRTSGELAGRVWEIHPELCFYYWNREQPMRHAKKSGFGFVERYELARSIFGESASAIRAAIPESHAADDDILDALAALWTATRIHDGTAIQLPESPDLDAHGLPMRMMA
ncbi:MAG TPA: DUF429 domain-containing protein, partial [Verrucomicrobiae bacterium]|nr:DUF429 domain-containing protein [Verrucomicrobiae bacterium]